MFVTLTVDWWVGWQVWYNEEVNTSSSALLSAAHPSRHVLELVTAAE